MNAVKYKHKKAVSALENTHLREVIGFPATDDPSVNDDRLPPLERGVLWLFSLLFVIMLVVGQTDLFGDIVGFGLLAFIAAQLMKL